MGKHFRLIRRIIIYLSLIICSIFMAVSFIFLLEPSGQLLGFDAILLRLQAIFSNHMLFRKLYFVTAILMFLVAIPHMVCGFLLIVRVRGGMTCSIVASLVLISLMLFFIIIFPQFIYLWIVLLLSIVNLILSLFGRAGQYQYNFYFNENDYSHINQSQNILVVYYAVNNYIKKYAYGLAERFNGTLYEIQTLEEHSFKKIWFSSIYKKPIEIKPININLTAYESVYLITPVWINSVASPVVSFCKQARGKIVNAEYDFVYKHTLKPIYPILEIDNLLKIKRKTAFYTQMHYGEVQKIQIFR